MLEFLFGPGNPTRNWNRSGLELTCDVRRAELNQVPLGTSVAQLDCLGPAEDRRTIRAGDARYYSLALSFGFETWRQRIGA